MKLAVFFAGLAVLMAIPMMLYFQLHVGSWDIWYLNVLPLWVILGIMYLLHGKIHAVDTAKWVVSWYLGYWLLYDFTWWGITAAASPGSVTWTTPFYFDIIVRQPQMWLFLLVAVTGFVLSVMLLATKNVTWTKLAPYIIYLVYVYALGGFTQYVGPVSDLIYVLWSLVLVPVAVIGFMNSYKVF